MNSILKRQNTYKFKQLLLLALPFLLTLSCAFVFEGAASIYGNKVGYFIGFLFYWLFWCTFIPVQLIGSKIILQSFSLKQHTSNWQVIACLLVPLIFVYAYAFPVALQDTDVMIVVLSFLLAVVNATAEEVLWRGVYLNVFKENKWLSILFASIGFAIWHYAPQIVFINKRPGGAHSFVSFSFFLGLCYAYAANKQQSILWTTIAHTLFDFAGLGARIYLK